LSDVSILNFKRNDSLVLDAAGKCILSLHSAEDMRTFGEHPAVKNGGSSKGKKRPAKPLLTTPAPPKKRRRIKDSEDELLLPKSKVPPVPDQSMEGSYFILPT